MSTVAPVSDPISSHNGPLPTLEQLPDDKETLKGMIVELVVTIRQDRRDMDALRHRVDLLLQRLYGPRTERFNPDQGLLFPEDVAAQGNDTPAASNAAPPSESDESERKSGKRRRCKPHGRGRLPENLPRRPLHHQLSDAERLCICGHVRVDIGTDVSEQLDWQPASLFIWQHFVHKYACPDCGKKSAEKMMTPADHSSANTPTTGAAADNTTTAASSAATSDASAAAASSVPARPIGPAVISAPKPAMPIAKGLPGAGLLAHVIVSKYFDHLPLYRQEPILARQGVSISRSTTCDWMAASAELLRPLYDMMVCVRRTPGGYRRARPCGA